MQLKAKQAFPCAGKSLAVGDQFEVSPDEAMTLLAIGYAEEAEQDEPMKEVYITRNETSEDPIEDEPPKRLRGPDKRPRKTYKRRDMVAE